MNGRNTTKIALVKPAFDELFVWEQWADGLYGALNELGKTYSVKVFGYCETPAVIMRDNIEIQLTDCLTSLRYWLKAFNPKLIMGWGVSYDQWKELDGYEGAKILLYAGGTPDKRNAYSIFDAVVVENPSDAVHFDTKYVAFGTNTDVFRPMKLNKMVPAFYPAAFALYKRHDLWSKSVPAGSLAVGHIQPHEMQCYEVVVEGGHMALPMIGMESMPYLYNQSIATVLTAEYMGGCQRAALESMACNVPVITTQDSKASEFDGVWAVPPFVRDLQAGYLQMVTQFIQEPVDLRTKYIIGKYDHVTYAKKLNKVIRYLL